MIEVTQADRIAAMAPDVSRGYTQRTDLREKIEQFARALETDAFSNVATALNEWMCCNGHHCGCRGATVGEYLAYEVRTTLLT